MWNLRMERNATPKNFSRMFLFPSGLWRIIIWRCGYQSFSWNALIHIAAYLQDCTASWPKRTYSSVYSQYPRLLNIKFNLKQFRKESSKPFFILLFSVKVIRKYSFCSAVFSCSVRLHHFAQTSPSLCVTANRTIERDDSGRTGIFMHGTWWIFDQLQRNTLQGKCVITMGTAWLEQSIFIRWWHLKALPGIQHPDNWIFLIEFALLFPHTYLWA